MERDAWIYAIHDENGTVVYVGATRLRTPLDRYRIHLSTCARGKSPVHRWMRSRLAVGHVPSVTALEKVSAEMADARERWWIQYHHGPKSLNVQGRRERDPRDKPPAVRESIRGRQISGHMPHALVDKVDVWRSAQIVKVTRSAAVAALVSEGLDALAKRDGGKG